MGKPSITKDLRRRRVRKYKLALLKKRYLANSSDTEKKKILTKVQKIAPWMVSEFSKKHRAS